jgi:hypothetical protein
VGRLHARCAAARDHADPDRLSLTQSTSRERRKRLPAAAGDLRDHPRFWDGAWLGRTGTFSATVLERITKSAWSVESTVHLVGERRRASDGFLAMSLPAPHGHASCSS